MKRLALYAFICSLATGCAGTSLQEDFNGALVELSHTIERAQHVYDAGDQMYWALCAFREVAPECQKMRKLLDDVADGTNGLLVGYSKANATAKAEAAK